MWTRTHSLVTREVSREQLWKLFTDVNNWHQWDNGIEFARMEGRFEKGNHFTLRPKGGPNVKIELTEVNENRGYTDVTRFPGAKMIDVHLFEDTPEGVKITNRIMVKGILGFLWIKLVAGKIADSMPEDMQRQVRAAAKLS
jgi:hypothetical protein